MEVYEKINYLVSEKKITKKEFADKLLSLEPRLKQTGEIPSIQSIYRYLNGQREIKVELIPYIAEALGVKEQELFEFNIEYSTEYNYTKSKDVREIVDLLQYLPNNAIENLKSRLCEYKKVYDKKFDTI